MSNLPTPDNTSDTLERGLALLRKYWKYDSFRSIQGDIILSVCSGKDTLGLMPTGGGKSITFQIPSLLLPGTCIVITPLIALMKDQVARLKQMGIKATAIYSGMTRDEIIQSLENCILGGYKFLYISPERIKSELFQAKLAHINVNLITVDEAHCISQWGYDFRPSYLQISSLRKMKPEAPVLALTASATPAVVRDIQDKLLFKSDNVFRMSFDRPNLVYSVRNVENKDTALIDILLNTSGSAIIYTRNREQTIEVAKLLNKNNIKALAYHAGMNAVDKDTRQQLWHSGLVRVMVSTNAFGMGIDKPDVRLVIHIGVPDSLEAYYQEAGRAGRDNKPAQAILLKGRYDIANLKRHIDTAFPSKEYIRNIYLKLCYYYELAIGDGYMLRKEFNL
ncbi:MAG: RecQ family ATP-dependent DNA helicase, partial [Bacteroidaceae bacterium]